MGAQDDLATHGRTSRMRSKGSCSLRVLGSMVMSERMYHPNGDHACIRVQPDEVHTVPRSIHRDPDPFLLDS